MYLNEFIHVDNKIARSVNLERDATNIEQIRQFQVTPMARRVINRFIEALNGEPETAWSLTGPYGTGKSAFCNFLFALCADGRTLVRKEALANLKSTDLGLHNSFLDVVQKSKIKGFIPLRAVSIYEPLNKTLLRSLEEALHHVQTQDSAELVKAINVLKSRSDFETSDIFVLMKKTSEFTGKKLLIVVDEFGKNLEFMAHHPDAGDIYILQALAESNFTFLWVCLHQAFSEYASSLSQVQRNEWRKIQGRFEDISYLEPPSHVINLISRSISQKNNGNSKDRQLSLRKWAGTYRDLLKEVNMNGISRMGLNKIKKLYPFSPLAAISLGELSHRFAQNDRTIFSFLSNGSPKSFSGYLTSHKIEKEIPLPTLTLDWLYDYFSEITTQIHGDRATTQRWIEIQTLIAGHENGPPFELKLLKTIGVLNLLSNVQGIRASRVMIELAMGTEYEEDEFSVNKKLDQLVADKVVLHREYADEYRLWEGTDFDLEKAVREERARLSLGTLEKMVEITSPQPSVIAARHSFQTGTVREFKQSWTTLDLLEERKGQDMIPCQGSDGQIWLVLGRGEPPDSLSEKTADQPLIIGYAPYENQVTELALDAAAAKNVFQTHSQLSQDGVARREARFRADATADILKNYLSSLVSPSNKKIQWYAFGKEVSVQPGRGLSSVVSNVCDHFYHLGPDVHMEMINHNRLTPAAARAQRELMEAMVTCEAQKDLGLEGFGPEKAIYMAMFKSYSLHKPDDKENTWRFIPPDPGNKNHEKLAIVWTTVDKLLEKTEVQGKVISLTRIIRRFQEPPYGLRKGPIPLFICHYLVVNDDDVAVYQDGIYKPFLGKSEAALMLKRPDLFTFKRFSSSGPRKEIVLAYKNALNTDALKLGETRNQSLLKIIAPLVNFIKGLPDFTQFTRRISLQAQKMRSAVLNAREPISLLLVEIPDALEMQPYDYENTSKEWKETLCQKLQDVLIELYDVYPQLNAQIQHSIISAFNSKHTELQNFRSYFQEQIKRLVDPCQDMDLKIILKAIMNTKASDDDWIRGIAGVIIKKPVDSWQDSDLDPWHLRIKEVSERIKTFESLVGATQGLNGSGKRMVLSLTRDDGSMQHKIVEVSEKDKQKLFDKYPGLGDLSREQKERLCAILMDDLGDL